MTLPCGTLLVQRYEVRGFVGSDGTLEVYKGLDLRLGRDIAITVLDMKNLQDPDKLLTFEKEAQIRAALHHPRLMTIHDFGHDAACAFQIAEWLEGESLRKRLKAGPLTWPEALSIGREVMEGLDVIHSRNFTLTTLDETSVFLHQEVGAKLFAYALNRLDGPGGIGRQAADHEGIRALAELMLDGLRRGDPVPKGIPDHDVEALLAIARGEGTTLRARFESVIQKAPATRNHRKRYWFAAGLLATCSGLAYFLPQRNPPDTQPVPNANPPEPAPQPVQDSDARRLYLYGMQLLDHHDPDSFRRALTYLQGAITREASYAPAQNGLGECYALMGMASLISREEALRLSRASIRQALEIDSTLGEAYATAAFLEFWYERNPQEADKTYLRALELAPQQASVHHGYGAYLACAGRQEEGLRRLKQAIDLQPLSHVYRISYATHLHWAGRSKESLEELAKIAEQDPIRPETLLVQREVLEQLGRLEESVQISQQLAELGAIPERDASALRTAYEARNAKGYWNERVRQMEQSPAPDPVKLAELVVSSGDRERTFRLLNRALRENSLQSARIPHNPAFASLRTDPRFQLLQKQLWTPSS
jgi:tetratricopeptide (TPR) repeat protein